MPGTRNGIREAMMPVAPMFHGNAWNQPFISCYIGAKLILPGRAFDADSLWELLDGERATIAAAVPTVWMLLVDHMRSIGKTPSALRLAMISGTAPSSALVEALNGELGIDTFLNYGSTEVLGGSAGTLVPQEARFEPAPIDERLYSGRTMFTPKLRLVDEEGAELPKDGSTKGHLQFKGVWVASGYLNAEGGSPLDKDGWFFTGDIGSIDPEGRIRVSDRAKDVIKSGGEWISSQELEAAAATHPAVSQVAVISMPDPKWQERPLMVIVKKPGVEATAADLLEHLSSRVAKWWLPDAVEFVDALPLTGTGKVHKPTLRQQFNDYKPATDDA